MHVVTFSLPLPGGGCIGGIKGTSDIDGLDGNGDMSDMKADRFGVKRVAALHNGSFTLVQRLRGAGSSVSEL